MLQARKATDLVVVHCSATSPSANIGKAEIDKWHRAKGWVMIGYHLVIRRDGTVEAGRPLDTVGAHAEGHNATSIGICLVGGVDAHGKAEDNFTDAQFESLANMLWNIRTKLPGIRIVGHRDLPKVAKDCPSFDVAAFLKRQGL